MVDPNNADDIKNLRLAVESSHDALEHMREDREGAIRDYVGNHYADPDSGESTGVFPVNFVEMAVNVFRRSLAANNPKVYSSTRVRQLKPFTLTLSKAVNARIEEMNLVDELERYVTDALIGPMGIMKTGRDVLGGVEHDGQTFNRSRTYARTIDPDDWVHDTTARRWSECAFMGHKLRMRQDAFEASPLFRRKDGEELKPADLTEYTEKGEAKVERIGTPLPHDQFVKYFDYWELWLPREKRLLYIPAKGNPRVLRKVKWKGPRKGPYTILGFGVVPNNPLPMAPIKDVILDLNRMANDMFCKMEDQARRQKSVAVVKPGSEDDADRIRKAKDGDMIAGDPTATAEVKSGGIDQLNIVAFMQAKRLLEYLAGNLPMLAGTAPMSETLGQDEMLMRSASERLDGMRSKTHRAVTEVVEAIAFYEWRDPLIDPLLEEQLPGGVTRRLDFSFNRRQAQGRFDDYRIEIHPYSLRDRSPAMRIAEIDRWITSFVLPALPLFEANGITLNVRKLLELRSRLLDLPELEDILTTVDQGQDEQKAGEKRQSPVTERINTRVNRPGATPQGQEDVMMRSLMGVGTQGSEANAMFREAG